jgi:16S rRNA (cytosine1402-N4)-methyltransferase
MHQEEPNHHIPVLLNEVLQYLQPTKGESYLDLTGGYGGHAGAVLEKTQNPTESTLVDRDANAITALKERFSKVSDIRQADFLTASQQLSQEGKQFDMILADLGVSSPHLNQASRGFAFSQDGPLDMRMDQSQELTAEKVVNTFREKELARIIKQYGEDPKAHQIAARIVRARPLKTTHELAKVVAAAWPGYNKTHPASRTFQALRIFVNDELTLIRKSLPIWINLLKPGGRLAVISFHSLEDRIVKQFLAEHAGDRYDADLTLLTKRPVEANSDEVVFNPRARSAKLRAAVKK